MTIAAAEVRARLFMLESMRLGAGRRDSPGRRAASSSPRARGAESGRQRREVDEDVIGAFVFSLTIDGL